MGQVGALYWCLGESAGCGSRGKLDAARGAAHREAVVLAAGHLIEEQLQCARNDAAVRKALRAAADGECLA
jgi:hypothetical protein